MNTRNLALLALAFLAAPASALLAAPPVASFIFPAGGQRGTQVPVRVGGLFLHDQAKFGIRGAGVTATEKLQPLPRIWFEGPIIPIPESQQAEDYPVDRSATITIDAQAKPGPVRPYLWTAGGVATGPVFLVGDLPEVVERETDGDAIPDLLPLNATANGRIFPRQDIDLWTVTLKAGQPLGVVVHSARLNSPLVPRVQIVDLQGRVLAEQDPRAGLEADASARYTATRDETVHVRISDVRGQGGPAFVYRMTATTGPLVDAVFPLGAQRGTEVALQLRGQKIPAEPVRIRVPADAPRTWRTSVAVAGHSIPVVLDLEESPEFLESGTTSIPAPAVLNGTVPKNGEAVWKLDLQKGKRYEFDFRARIGIVDPNGKEVASVDAADPGFDPTTDLTPTTDGTFTVRISERFRNRGGPEFAYRLAVKEAQSPRPDFRLRLASETLNVPRGGTAKLKLLVERLGGFAGPIEIAANDLPPGVTLAKTTIAKGQANVDLTFTAEALARVQVGRATISGTSPIGDGFVSRAATAATSGENTPGLLVMPTVPTPFKFGGEYTMNNSPRGQPYSRTYQIERNGFTGTITIQLADRQARHLQGAHGPTLVIPPEKSEFEYAAMLPAWIEIGRTCRVCLMAVGIVSDPDGTHHTVSFTSVDPNHQLIVVPEPGRLGLDLDRPSVAVAPGETVRIGFQLARSKALEAEAKIEALVPAHWRGIQVESFALKAGQVRGELILKAAKSHIGPFNMPLTIRATVGNVIAETNLDLVRKE
jgi:hypothetical protein